MGIEMDVGEWDRAGFCLGPGRLVVLCGRGDLSVLAMGVYGLDGPAWNGRSVARKGPGMGRERYSLLWGVGFGGWGIVGGFGVSKAREASTRATDLSPTFVAEK